MGLKIYYTKGTNLLIIVLIFMVFMVNFASSATTSLGNLDDTGTFLGSPDTSYWYSDWLIDYDANVCSAGECNGYIKWDLSPLYSIDNLHNITDASLRLSNYFNSPTTYIYEVNNHSWIGTATTWNNAPASGGLINSSTFGTPASVQYFNITPWIQSEFSAGDQNASIMFNASASCSIASKERTSGGPILTITYSEYIEINSPSSSEIFSQDAPTTLFKITNSTPYDVCYAELDSTTNYTVPYDGSNIFQLTNTSMVDGSHSVRYWCNQSSDGAWRKTDSVSFEVDSLNVTVCRNMDVVRQYELLNDITSTIDCFTTSSNGITLDGNNFNLNGDDGQFDDAITISNSNTIVKNINISNFGNAFNTLGAPDNTLIENVTLYSNSKYGVYVGTAGSDSFTINNSNLDSNGNATFFYSSTGHQIINTNISNSVTYDVVLQSSSNTVLNSTFSQSYLSDTSTLTREWYLSLRVNDSNGNLQSANVSIYDVDNNLEVSELTDSNGQISRQEIVDYINVDGVKTSNTPHTINITKTDYVTNSTTYNFTLLNSVDTTTILVLEDRAPQITIVDPKAQTYSTNESLSLNYSIYDLNDDVDSCWYKLVNSTGSLVTSNTTLTSCSNSTFNVSQGAGDFTLTLYANDSSSNLNQSSVTFQISLTHPAVVLDYPTDNLYLNNGTTFINFTATDPDGLSTCELWGNFTGSWTKNYTWVNPTNATQNFTQLTLSDKDYSWNVWCNDSSDNGGFAFSNFSFTIDTTDPTVLIDSVTPTAGSQTVSVSSTITDANLDSCKYSVYNSTSGIDGLNENVSFTCNNVFSATVTAYGDYTMRVYAVDLASNENYTESNFTTAGTTPGGGGGSNGDEVERIPAIALEQIEGGVYSELERAIFYARLNSYCSEKKTDQTFAISDFSGECSLKKSDIEIIQVGLIIEGFSPTVDELILFYDKYSRQLLLQTYQTLDVIKTYDLFTSVLGITNPMRVNPPRLDKPIIVYSDGETIIVEQVFTVNKDIRDCVILSGEGFNCELISNTSVKMVLEINNTDFFDKIFDGEMSITSEADPANLEVKRIVLIPRVYNFYYKFYGVPAVYLLVLFGVILLAFSLFFILRARINKNMKRRKN